MTKEYELITRIPLKGILPHATELVLRCGSCEKAAKYADIGVGTMYRIVVYREYESVQLEIARKIIDSLIIKRREDRRNGKVSDVYRRSVIAKSKVDERMERTDG